MGKYEMVDSWPSDPFYWRGPNKTVRLRYAADSLTVASEPQATLRNKYFITHHVLNRDPLLLNEIKLISSEK